MSLADARYHFKRIIGLIRRGLASLRTRGWRATLHRVGVHARRQPPPQRSPLFVPEAAPFAPFAVPTSDRPRASIVIPVYNHCAHTLACLRALAAHPPRASCEILVIDDGSSDATIEWMPRIEGLRYHVRPQNGGFIAACNDGLRLSRGEYVVLLNNDTLPQPGWLDALLATFENVPDAGLVGAQLLYPDGRLQESGGVVFDDGSCWSYGRFESAEDPRFSSLRDTDYCSGAAIAIPRELFNQLGGLDTRYAPAYYEDTDLAFKVRAAGRRVLVQPASRVIHDEGTSNGTSTDSGIKAYQVRNQQVFVDKWRDALASHLPVGSIPSPANQHREQRQILILDESVPQPDRDSASLRQYNLIRMLLRDGAHVVFVPTRGEHAGPATEALRAIGVEVWHAPFLKSVGGWLREHGSRFSVVMLVRYHLAHECLALVQQFAPRARTVFDTVDLHYLRERRGAELAADSGLMRSAERTRAAELSVMNAVDVTVLVSAAEKEQLAVDAPSVRVELISNLHEVAGRGPDWTQRRDLVFVGGFRHLPNLDAMQWFMGDVFPRVRQQLPDVHFHCIGADVPDSILALAANHEGITVHGYVPDVVPYMEGCRIAVAPLRFGAGVKGKINLSMAHGQPVVATTCAVEGMHLLDGQDVLVADDAQAFADAIVRLYSNPTLWQQLSESGLCNISRHFSLEAAQAAVQRVFFELPAAIRPQ